jgi:hypothetical protein
MVGAIKSALCLKNKQHETSVRSCLDLRLLGYVSVGDRAFGPDVIQNPDVGNGADRS